MLLNSRTPAEQSNFSSPVFDPARNLPVRTLRSVLIGTLLFGAFYLCLVVPFFAVKKPAAGAFWATIVAAALVCVFLLRQGYVRLSGWIFLSAIWLILAAYIVLSGGIRSPAALSHIAIIVVSAWLAGRRATIWMGVLTLAFGLYLAIMESAGAYFPRYFIISPMVAWLIAAGLVGLTILPLMSVNQALADSVDLARRELEARRREERVRAESEERFRATFFQAAVGIAHVGLAGEWLLINDRYCQMLGYTADELRHKRLEEITYSDDIQAISTRRSQLTADDVRAHISEIRYLRKDGTIFWANQYQSLIRDVAGQPKYFLEVIEDLNDRKQAELALRESEERFRNMADAAPVMIWASGLDKLCNFFNGPWLEFTGRTMEQELGNGWAEGVHPEDFDRCLATYISSFDARQNFRMEYRLRRADGEYRWILDTGTPLYRGSEFAGFIGSCVDITDQKETEARLRAREIQLVDAQRLAKVGGFELHIAADQIYWSDEVSRIFGIQNGGPSDFSIFLECVHPRDRDRVSESARKARLVDSPVETEYRIVRPDGEVRFVCSIVEAIRDNLGEPVRLNWATQDITAQAKARELLRESEERLKSAERIARVGHWEWDLRTNRVSGSEEMFQILGQSGDRTTTYEAFLQMLVPEDRGRMDHAVRESIGNKTGRFLEYKITDPRGDLKTISCTWEILLDEDGAPVRLFGACQDVTESRRAQEESFARQKLESVGTLANGIAHDFNNLLGAVLAQAELGLGEFSAGSSPQEELTAIRDAALRGSEIVRQLMIYAGKETTDSGPADISQTVQEMLELLRVSVSKHAALEVNLSQALPAVQASAAQIRQIVMNLITNASDAVEDRDGVIRVNTRWVRAGLDSDNGYVALEITDTGRGMEPETQAKVFDPFFTTKSGGHGLGLAIVHGIVRALGGSIELSSEPGKGTIFRVLLPCVQGIGPAFASTSSDIVESKRQFHDATVLVVEDESILREATAKMLRKTGLEVLEAADGSSAIRLLRATNKKIDVILLDVTIPGASSSDVVAEAAKARPEVSVILTSAYGQEMISGVMGEQRQIRSYIRKPFQIGSLVQTLKNALST